ATAEYRELRKRLAVMVELRLLFVGRIGDAVRAGKKAVHVIEAAVLAVDHHNGFYFCEAFLRGRRLQADRLSKYGCGAHEREFGKSHSWPLKCRLDLLQTIACPDRARFQRRNQFAGQSGAL